MGMYPRQILEDRICSNTQRTVDGQFLFKPCAEVRNIIGASAGRAQRRYPVKIYWLEFNINHVHDSIAPLSGSQEHIDNVVLFRQTFHRILAEEINRLYERDGSIFSGPSRSIPCLDDESLEDKFFYALTNPVKDGLVDKVSHWKGFSSFDQVASGKRPDYTYFDRTAWHRQGRRKPLTAYVRTVSVEFSPLPSMTSMKPHQRQAHIRREVRAREQAFRQERMEKKQRPMSKKKLDDIDPRMSPRTKKPRTKKPLYHSSCMDKASQFMDEFRAFRNAYITASALYRQGVLDVVFPKGSFRPPLIQTIT